MKINRDELPGPEQNPELWAQIVAMDRAYWDKLYAELTARPEFSRDTDAQKTFSKLRSAIGGVYAYRRLISEAEYAYQQARALCPDSPEANFRLAQLYLEQNRVDDALAVLNELQRRDPLNAKIAQSIQQIGTMRQGRLEVQQFEAAFAANPRDIQILIQLAQAYLKAGQPDKVGPLCDRYLAQPGISAGDMIQITQVYLSLRQLDRAIATLQLIISRYPQESQAYYGLAIIRAAQGFGLDALEALARAIEINPALRDQARNDARFNNLRGNPRFQQITGATANPFNLN
jgi:tetratricopeptide (TPR) repeat protein